MILTRGHAFIGNVNYLWDGHHNQLRTSGFVNSLVTCVHILYTQKNIIIKSFEVNQHHHNIYRTWS